MFWKFPYRPTLAVALWVLVLGCSAFARSIQLLPPGEGGQVRAVIVGIDKYKNYKNLLGAVADARDIQRTLTLAGVTDLVVLIDQDATRQRFESAMGRIVEVSTPGDLVVVSFAGHGAQMPEQVKGSEADGMDEVFLLAGFSEHGSGTSERILDDELHSWMSRLDKKGVNVLFIADTCHGGGLMRKPDFRAADISYRWAGTVSLIDDSLKPVSTEQDASLTVNDLPNVTFLAAVDKYSKAPEVFISGSATKRGALSYAFARSIDRGQNGAVTRGQLFKFARQLTYQYSQTQQSISTEPSRGGLDKPIFRLSVSGEPEEEAEVATEIRLKAMYLSDRSLLASLEAVRIKVVTENEPADLIWDVSKGELLNEVGDLISSCRTTADVVAIVERTRAMAAIALMSERAVQEIRLLPNDRRFHGGELASFRIDGISKKFLILLNVTGDGEVRLLFPVRSMDSALVQSGTFELPLKVNEPYGTDAIIAIVSDERLLDLESQLNRITGQRSANSLRLLMASHLRVNRSARVGLASVFTSR
ncbi:hypothetical protein CSIRO_0751 [Bradyrhizobiaceae bacterium SG-6C]|nr:hypothetical protein CSIRO_0751 [Bradyrhizobiaceae bacterium SG-6C]